MRDSEALRAVLFGTPGADYNLGVAALRLSLLDGILQRRPTAELVAFDDGFGTRTGELPGDEGGTHRYTLRGVRLSRRVHRPESYANMFLSARLRGLGNPGARAILESDAVLDVSGGDSFADIYGLRRFRSMLLPKQLAVRTGKPLVLLPQTYGPFTDARARAQAAEVVRSADACWSRDGDSHSALLDLAGGQADPDRFHTGVDMAFALPARRPSSEATADAIETFTTGGEDVAGVNISGLLYNEPESRGKYGLNIDYRETTRALVRHLLDDGAKVLLVPHVLGPEGPVESDTGACLDLLRGLTPAQRERVLLLPDGCDAMETKWAIARTDWFCGARMHSTIAGLSSGVPTFGVAYSLKFAGVFESFGQREAALEARNLDDGQLLEALLTGWRERPSRDRLVPAAGVVVERARRQMDDIVAHLEDLQLRRRERTA